MNFKFFILFIPLFLGWVTIEYSPFHSFLISWSGSFLVYFLTFSGFLKPIPRDRSLLEQSMRPIFIPHLIFTGYMSVTSIFYFLSANGYYYFEKDELMNVSQIEIQTLAECQFYYLTAHIFYIIGLLTFMNYKKPKYVMTSSSISETTLKISIYSTIITAVVRFIPGLEQIFEFLSNLSLTASVLSLAYAIPEKKFFPILISGSFFLSNYAVAIMSGWKESIIMPLILLGGFLYSNYKKTVTVGAVVVLYLFFYYVPSYNMIIRNLTWNDSELVTPEEAREIAISAILNNEVDIVANNWAFLTDRLSEIGMFQKYVSAIPEIRENYGFQIVNQSLFSIIPRIIYKDKPNTEQLVMERVVENGIVSKNSKVSAKPPFIVDSFLSFEFLGVVIGMFVFGSIASIASVRAEKLFGGYELGTCLMFIGLFKQLLRGNCYEFIFNNIFWGFVLLSVAHYLSLKTNILKKNK